MHNPAEIAEIEDLKRRLVEKDESLSKAANALMQASAQIEFSEKQNVDLAKQNIELAKENKILKSEIKRIARSEKVEELIKLMKSKNIDIQKGKREELMIMDEDLFNGYKDIIESMPVAENGSVFESLSSDEKSSKSGQIIVGPNQRLMDKMASYTKSGL